MILIGTFCYCLDKLKSNTEKNKITSTVYALSRMNIESTEIENQICFYSDTRYTATAHVYHVYSWRFHLRSWSLSFNKRVIALIASKPTVHLFHLLTTADAYSLLHGHIVVGLLLLSFSLSCYVFPLICCSLAVGMLLSAPHFSTTKNK